MPRKPSPSFRAEVAAAKAQSHWSASQRNHLRRLIKQGAHIAFWCSDAQGRPANHDMDPIAARAWTARPGLVQEVQGPLAGCSGRALHATWTPHMWRGCRVWVVGLIGAVETTSDKFAALRREIVGEVLPEEATSASVGVRIGRKDLDGARLDGARLDGARLDGASLVGASLDGARLDGASLVGASLSRSVTPPLGWVFGETAPCGCCAFLKRAGGA